MKDFKAIEIWFKDSDGVSVKAFTWIGDPQKGIELAKEQVKGFGYDNVTEFWSVDKESGE